MSVQFANVVFCFVCFLCFASIVALLLGAAGGTRVGVEKRSCAPAAQSRHRHDV